MSEGVRHVVNLLRTATLANRPGVDEAAPERTEESDKDSSTEDIETVCNIIASTAVSLATFAQTARDTSAEPWYTRDLWRPLVHDLAMLCMQDVIVL